MSSRERVESGDYTEDYTNTDIQSGLTEARPGEEEASRMITVYLG